MSRPVVVADSGPLIALAGCGQLDLLVAVFDTLHVPQKVLDEICDWRTAIQILTARSESGRMGVSQGFEPLLFWRTNVDTLPR